MPTDSTVELHVSLGRAEEAVEQAKKAMRYNSRHSDWYLDKLGWAQYFAGQHEEAVATLEGMLDMSADVSLTFAAALVHIAMLERVKDTISEFRKENPNYGIATL